MGGMMDAAGGAAGGAPDARDGGYQCYSYPYGPILDITRSSSPLPTFVGGTIQDGKYYLTAYTIYGPINDAGDAGTGKAYGTLGFAGGDIFYGLSTTGGYSTRIGTFVTSGATLYTQTTNCNADSGAVDSLNYAYTVAGQDILTRLSPDPIVATWTLMP
jgi:hypothetical protein